MRKIFFILLTNIIITASFAQVDYSNPKKYEIEKINISGVRFLSEEALILLSGLHVGQEITIPGDDISEAIQKLWEQNLFSDVKISFTESGGNKIILNILLQEQARLNKVYFLGIKKSQKTDLEEKLNLKPGRQLTDNILNQSENIIQAFYEEKGFLNTVVTYTIKDDTTMQNMVNLYIDIDKQNKVKIDEIIIRGNTAFSDNKIKRNLKETKQKNTFRIWKTSKYIKDNFKEDQKTLIAKYNKAGYRDARIVEDSVYITEDGLLNMYMKIHEGNKYYYRSITWVGNTKYTTEQLSTILDIKVGDVYNQERLDNRLIMAEDAVGNLYLDNGYLFYQSIPREVKIENDSVDLEIIVIEGNQARINRMTLQGNTRTNDHVPRREIRTLPGELFSKSDIIRSVRELAQLGNFDPENLVPTPLPNQSSGNVDIDYAVIEKSNDMFELSGGWGMMGFIGRVGVRFNNFSMRNIAKPKYWAPLPMGDGQQLSFSANIGASSYQLYSVSFMEPWLGGKKANSLSVSLYYNLMSNGITERTAQFYGGNAERQTMQLYGASIGLGRRLKKPDDYFVHSAELSYQRYYIDGLTSYIRAENGAYNIFSFNNTIARNSIDNPLYSRRGSNLSVGLKVTPPYSSILSLFSERDWQHMPEHEKFEWVELYKITVKGDWYFQIAGDLVFRTAFEYGILGNYNKDIGYSPFEAYELGGDGMGYYTFGKDYVGLRGYENQSLTATSGAHLYNKYTAEIRHPVLLKDIATIYALGFLEAGNSWNTMDEMNPFDIKRSAGVGVRLFLPMLGQLGVDFGWGFDKPIGATEISGFQYHFVFGQQF